ncbi:MAG: HNH endonuclease signature motif containing protein [Burkholderiales bacterium]|nr:HNH endonuclease signature motif containing protein [Burkholderiales bacterium]
MPTAIKRHRPTLTLKPKLKELDLFKAKGFTMLDTRTLKQKQQANGRTLALDGKEWRTLRAYVLSGEPLCRHCINRGLTTLATEVDHDNNDPTDNRLVNLQPLCKSCHSIKTMAELHGRTAPMGCDVHGMPLDPTHPWNVAEMAQRSRGTGDAKPNATLRACDRSLADHG